MMLVGKSSNTQPVCLRTLNNTFPIDEHRNIRVADLFERRIQISMLGTDLKPFKLLVQKSVIDDNQITPLQVHRDLVDGLERGFIENRLINWPLDEYKLVAVETYKFLCSITDQVHRHCIQ